jgi:hypothetical protein
VGIGGSEAGGGLVVLASLLTLVAAGRLVAAAAPALVRLGPRSRSSESRSRWPEAGLPAIVTESAVLVVAGIAVAVGVGLVR